jgi:hypothetical protein
MRAVLTELMLLMHGSTTSWNPTTRGTRDRDPRPTGDSYPVAENYRDQYAQAPGDIARRRVLNEARAELERWRGHGTQRHAGETRDEQEARILKEGQGFDPQTVAIRFDTNAGRIRKLRVTSGYLPETGEPLPGIQTKVASADKVRELAEQGCTLRQIKILTGVSKSTAHRILGRAA